LSPSLPTSLYPSSGYSLNRAPLLWRRNKKHMLHNNLQHAAQKSGTVQNTNTVAPSSKAVETLAPSTATVDTYAHDSFTLAQSEAYIGVAVMLAVIGYLLVEGRL